MNISIASVVMGAAMLASAAGLIPARAQALPPATQTTSAEGAPVVVIVRIPKPWYAPKVIVVGRMHDTMDEYASVPGLLFKAYSLERASKDFGGLYYWHSRASAQAWFTPAWFDNVRRERGAEPKVRTFEAPVTLDNTAGGTQASTDSSSVATLVEIPIPAGVSATRLRAEFDAAVASFQKVPGLLRKHFIISSDGNFGGIYLWKDEASARAWFTAAWHAQVVKTYGQDARIEWFDTPILLPSRDPSNVAAAQALTRPAP